MSESENKYYFKLSLIIDKRFATQDYAMGLVARVLLPVIGEYPEGKIRWERPTKYIEFDNPDIKEFLKELEAKGIELTKLEDFIGHILSETATVGCEVVACYKEIIVQLGNKND